MNENPEEEIKSEPTRIDLGNLDKADVVILKDSKSGLKVCLESQSVSIKELGEIGASLFLFLKNLQTPQNKTQNSAYN